MARDFSFAAYGSGFDRHIRLSIPGYTDLQEKCVAFSRAFIRDHTRVVDVGCTTGRGLAKIRAYNQSARPFVHYVGIDIEEKFSTSWVRRRRRNLQFECADARDCEFHDTTLVISLFTLQFLPPPDRLPLLSRIYSGLAMDGALMIAEKFLATDAEFQEIVSTAYQMRKLASFNAAEVVTKSQELYGFMRCWSEDQWRTCLGQAGFSRIEPFWKSFQFGAWLVRP